MSCLHNLLGFNDGLFAMLGSQIFITNVVEKKFKVIDDQFNINDVNLTNILFN